jgi:hypothetical protein
VRASILPGSAAVVRMIERHALALLTLYGLLALAVLAFGR